MEQRKVSSPLTAEAFTKLRATFPGLRIIDMLWVSHSRGLARAGLQRHGWYLLAATKLPMTLGPMPPASSCVAFYATLALACQTGWDLELCDAQSAYLPAESITRVLVLRLQRVNPPPGTKPGDPVRANGNEYGTRDAGRNWYRYLLRTLKNPRASERAPERPGARALRLA